MLLCLDGGGGEKGGAKAGRAWRVSAGSVEVS